MVTLIPHFPPKPLTYCSLKPSYDYVGPWGGSSLGWFNTLTWRDSHLRGNVEIKSELSSTLVERVGIELHISERAHKPNFLRFRVKVCYQSHLYGCSISNVLIQPSEAYPS
ncbi:hypothetical protein QL285_014103 [Trifolium repens]|jgi:hypothetical protein|nr:hypothetical protein QL285_014103 [Trifolium repens]